jgi:hypothetical protein
MKMKDFIFPQKNGFPEVKGYWDQGCIELKGDANPENIFDMFIPMNQWIFKYLTENNNPLTIHFKLTYINNSFSLGILDLVRQIDAKYTEKVIAKWYYEENDEDIYEEGDDLKSVAHFPFELISI